jgi:hypothetical protein
MSLLSVWVVTCVVSPQCMGDNLRVSLLCVWVVTCVCMDGNLCVYGW